MLNSKSIRRLIGQRLTTFRPCPSNSVSTMSQRPTMKSPLLLALLGVAIVLTSKGPLSAAEKSPLAGLPQRFADGKTSEVPDFQRHVIPLLSRLGCNGRACHGSFQGRGDFQLSLFGYDFAADHSALMAENSGRVDTDDAAESLIISKPTDADMHEGGKRYELGSWQHHVLEKWVSSGAPFEKSDPAILDRLEVIPAEILFHKEAQQQPLKVIAHWADGVQEDVTEICRFSSNDDAIAEVDETGIVTAGAKGDTHVVAYYDKAVVPIPVLRPLTELANAKYPDVPAKTNVDQLVNVKLKKLGILPSDVCTDADFLRRARLDITGTLPSASEVQDFLADKATDKRETLVKELLDSPEYAAWWATRMSDWTGNSEEQLRNTLPVRGVASKLWFAWIEKRLAENVPYDQIVEGMVMATSREPGEDYAAYCSAMTEVCSPGNEDKFAARESNPLYWGRQNFRSTEERAIGFAYAFMGIRIQCAQCHKHPFDQWSKDDFAEFGKLFQPIIAGNASSPQSKKERDQMLAKLELKDLKGGQLQRKLGELIRDGETVPFAELFVRTAPVRRNRGNNAKNRRNIRTSVPTGTLLGEDEKLTLDHDPRGALMDWLRAPENPYFTKALVNRVWANYFGVGLVQPTDDLNLANPPVNAPLMDYLATGFQESGFDMKWLHREIVLSDTYQRSWEPNETNASDKRNFSHFIPRRLPAEVVHDAIQLATLSDSAAEKIRESLSERAIGGKLVSPNRNRQNFALSVFGASLRETNCDCDRSDESSLLQSVYLRNDQDVLIRLSAKDGWVTEACRTLGVEPPTPQATNQVDPKVRQRIAMNKQLQARRKQLVEAMADNRKGAAAKIRMDIMRLRKRMNNPEEDSLEEKPSKVDSDRDENSIAKQEKQLSDVIDQAYLRTLSRLPEASEKELSLQFIRDSKSVSSGVESVVWSLINTKEFILNH